MMKNKKEAFSLLLYGSNLQEAAINVGRQIVKWAEANDVRLFVEAEFQHALCGEPQRAAFAPPEQAFDAKLAISVGGDGTFLRTAASLSGKHIPILGVNTGHLGFMADVKCDEVEQALQLVLEGKLKIEQRRTIMVKSESNYQLEVYNNALNEIAVLKHDAASMISVEVLVDGERLTHYMADGLIVATPTGSTGYSLSVGGPIVEPNAPCIVLNPVASHSLTSRPIVMPDNVELRLRVSSRSGGYLLSVDGRSEARPQGEWLVITRSPFDVQVATLPGRGYLDALKQKLGWGTDPRN